MPLTPGVITVNPDGTHSADAPDTAAEAVFDAAWDAYVAALAEFDQSVPTDPKQLAAVKKGLASMSVQFSVFTQYLKDQGSAGGDPLV